MTHPDSPEKRCDGSGMILVGEGWLQGFRPCSGCPACTPEKRCPTCGDHAKRFGLMTVVPDCPDPFHSTPASPESGERETWQAYVCGCAEWVWTFRDLPTCENCEEPLRQIEVTPLARATEAEARAEEWRASSALWTERYYDEALPALRAAEKQVEQALVPLDALIGDLRTVQEGFGKANAKVYISAVLKKLADVREALSPSPDPGEQA